MPYIEQSIRKQLHPRARQVPQTAGELNYQLTCLLDDYVGYHGRSYQNMNDVVGACEGAKLEFYRRVVVPYEAQKMHENGDVYTCV